MRRSLKKSFQFRNNCFFQLQDAYQTIKNLEEIHDALRLMLVTKPLSSLIFERCFLV